MQSTQPVTSQAIPPESPQTREAIVAAIKANPQAGYAPFHRAPKRKQSSKIFREMGINEAVRDRLDSAYPDFANSEDFRTRSIKPVCTFKTGAGALADLEIGPGRLTLFGAPPKYGKTDLVTQLAIDAAPLQEGVVVFVANAEMSPSTLMARQVARLSGVPLERFDQDELPGDVRDRLLEAKDTLQSIACGDPEIPDDISYMSEGRYNTAIQFCLPPFSTLNLMCMAAEAEQYAMRRPDQIIVVCDYVQRFSALDRSKFEKWKRYCERKRVSIEPPHVRDVDAVMSELRKLAATGVCVIAVSATNRDSYDNPSLGAFRGSSELEYAADDCFVLAKDDERGDIVHLRHVASRNSATRDRVLRFDGSIHKFTPAE